MDVIIIIFNEMNRRVFFKKASEKVLPFIGILFSTSLPLRTIAENSIAMSCRCGSNCKSCCCGRCANDCKGSCAGSCMDTCTKSCIDTCTTTCKQYCSMSCNGNCKNVCNYNCVAKCKSSAYNNSLYYPQDTCSTTKDTISLRNNSK